MERSDSIDSQSSVKYACKFNELDELGIRDSAYGVDGIAGPIFPIEDEWRFHNIIIISR